MHIITLSVYALKSRFQLLLKPLLNILINKSVSPNQITVFTCLLCVSYSALLAWCAYSFQHSSQNQYQYSYLLLCFPLFMFIRMALNALDGMLATATNNKTPLGAVLNEVCDVISDVALFSAFFYLIAMTHTINPILWLLLIFMAVLTEFVSLAVFQAKGIRSHSGPFGKSDRAVYLGLLAILLWAFPGLLSETSLWILAYIVVGLALSGLTIWNRFKSLNDLYQ